MVEFFACVKLKPKILNRHGISIWEKKMLYGLKLASHWLAIRYTVKDNSSAVLKCCLVPLPRTKIPTGRISQSHGLLVRFQMS